MLLLTCLLIITVPSITEGLAVTSYTSSPIINGDSVNLTFCSYSLNSGEYVTGISWSFAPNGGSSAIPLATFDPILGFVAESSHSNRLSRLGPNSGHLLLNDTTTNDSGNYSCTVVTNVTQGSSFSIETVVVPPNKANLTLTQVNEYLYCKGLTNAGTPRVSLQVVMVATSTAIATQESLTVTTRWNAFGNHICRAILINFPNFTVPGVVDGSHTVRDYPKVMNRSLSILTVENGDNITLEALITGDPAPQPAWSRGGTNTTTIINSTHILATLQFTASIREGETQLINCTASDDVGYGFVTFQIASQAPNTTGVPGTSVDTTIDTTMNTSAISSSPPSAFTSSGSGATEGGTSAYTSTVPSSNNLPSSTWSMAETSTPGNSTENSSFLANTTVDTLAGGDVYMNSELVGGIVGGIVGGFFFIVLLMLVIIFCVRRRKRGNGQRAFKNVNVSSSNGQPQTELRTTRF